MLNCLKDGRIYWLILNRQERRNALDLALIDSLHNALDQALMDDEIRVIVLRGEGKAFCAGADLDELRDSLDAPDETIRPSVERLAALYRKIYTCRCLVLAEVNGAALGGGCGLVAACDVAIGAESARLGFPEVRIGFVPAIVSGFVVRKVGVSHASNWLLTGSILTAREALAGGLLHEVVTDGMLHERVRVVAETVARETSPSAVAATKTLLARIAEMNLDAALEAGIQANLESRHANDLKAGLEAFFDGTPPPWSRPLGDTTLNK